LKTRIMGLLKNKMVQDGVLSIGAKCIFYFVVNFVIYSLMYRRMGDAVYGEFVVLLAYLQVFAYSCGEALNHIRVLHQDTDTERAADYRLVAVLECIIGGVIFVSGLFTRNMGIFERIMYAGIGVLMMLRLYTECMFRIQINYKRILLSSVICSAGYIIGFIFYVLGASWCVIFLCGEGAAVLYAAMAGKAFKAEKRKSTEFKVTLKNITTLTLSYLISYIVIYSDRFILEAFIDSELAGQYFNATYYGKLVAIVIPPITSVLLSNISKGTIKLDSKMVRKIVYLSLAAVGVFFIVGIPGARLMLWVLFPYSDRSVLSFIDIANLSLIVYYSCSIINMLAIRLCPYSLQVRVEIIYSICYIVAGVVGTYLYGALGFAVGSLIVNVLRFVMLWLPVERSVCSEGNGSNS